MSSETFLYFVNTDRNVLDSSFSVFICQHDEK
jgi:hypothetical protein